MYGILYLVVSQPHKITSEVFSHGQIIALCVGVVLFYISNAQRSPSHINSRASVMYLEVFSQIHLGIWLKRNFGPNFLPNNYGTRHQGGVPYASPGIDFHTLSPLLLHPPDKILI